MVQIYNLYGQMVMEFTLVADQAYPVHSLTNGAYLIKIGTEVKKLVIAK